MLKEKYTAQNKGLPMKFSLQGGKFVLVGGREKIDDNVTMLLYFVGWFRIYKQDYVIDAYRFLQNTTSYLFKFKNILRLQIMEIGRKYVPFANFYSVDLPIDYTQRKQTTILVQFQYKLKEVDDFQTIKKVII